MCKDPLKRNGVVTKTWPHQYAMVQSCCWSQWTMICEDWTLQWWIICICMHCCHNQSSWMCAHWHQVEWCHCQKIWEYMDSLIPKTAWVAHDNDGKLTRYAFVHLVCVLWINDVPTTNKNKSVYCHMQTYASDNGNCVKDITLTIAPTNTRCLASHRWLICYDDVLDAISCLNAAKGKSRSPCVFLWYAFKQSPYCRMGNHHSQ